MLVCQLTCNSQHRPHGHDVIKCNLDTGFWNKPTPECIPNTPVDPWDPYKHGKCKVPKSHGVGTWSCKTKMYSHDRTDEFEDDGEGKFKFWCALKTVLQYRVCAKFRLSLTSVMNFRISFLYLFFKYCARWRLGNFTGAIKIKLFKNLWKTLLI